jgi:hypothetical protein
MKFWREGRRLRPKISGQASRILCFILCERSTPVLRTVPDVHDFDNLFSGSVHNHVRRADKLAGSLHLSVSAKPREGCQLFNAVNNRLSNIPGSSGTISLDVFSGGFKLFSRFGCPPNLSHE